MLSLSTSTSSEGVQQHSNSSSTNYGIDNISNSGGFEKEEKTNSNNSGSKHHKDRRKLSTASSCSTSSTGSSTPTTSSNVPSQPESKTGATLSADDDQPQQQISGKHNKSTKSNNHHGHSHSHGHGHRHSSDSSSSSSSTSTKNHNKGGNDDLNEFDRLKREVPVNTINSRINSSNRKEKERQEREEKERRLEEERIQKEKDEMRRAQELKEKELEQQRRKEKELEEQRRKEKELEEQRRKEKELEEQRRKEREEAERREREERERQLQREQELEKERQLQLEREEREKAEREKWQKEEARKSKESPKNEFEPCDSFVNDHGSDRLDRVNSTDSNSQSQITSKRRHSSQESNDSPTEDINAMKKHKHNNIGERRDSGKDGKREKHHKSHNRSDKSSKSSSGSSTSSDKVHSHANALCSVGKHDNHDEKQQFLLEERRKEISFSGDGDSLQLSHHHKKKDRYHEKHKSKKDRNASRDKENTQNVNFPMDYVDHRSTSDEDEHARLQHRKERKSSKDYGQRFHGESGEEYKKYDRKSSRAESSADEEGRKKRNRTNNSRTKTTNSSDTDDSDEPKKHSIFDIPDDGPNISMYDKVKARSCKNMQRQEEEKKIKAKFSKLKQSRAKREGKNRSKSWDEDSDTDGMNSDTTINSKYNHKDHLNKSGTITTSEDDDHLPSTPRMRRPKEPLATDSEEETNRIRSNRDRLNDLCDDESSDGDHTSKRPPRTPRRSSDEKKMSRKNSRSTRIQSETDSDGHHSIMREKPATPNCDTKAEVSDVKMDHISIKQEMKSEEDTQEGISKVEIKVETRVQPPSALVTSDVSEDEDISKPIVKSELIPSTMIKKEPIDEGFSAVKNRFGDVSSEGEPNMISVANAEIENTVNSAVDQLMYGHSEGKKRHKKKQKRHKNVEGSETDVKSEKEHSPHDDAGSANSMFDELKKSSDDQIYVSSKKKHGGKKEKRRERSKEDHEKSGKSKKSKNKHKDSNKIPDAMSTNVKREEKIEDIFGPISDEESQHSSVETEVSIKQEPSDVKAEDTATLEEQPNECEQTEKEKNKEESRKKKEKKRREREKLRATISMKEEENSVDLDEAGRALEAQLMSDSDQKAEDASPTSTITTSGKRSSVDVMDVFRFTDGDDSMETSFTEKKESEHSRKEKKKKKKRGKDEKHKHHHGSSTNHSNPPTTTPITPTANKLSLDIISAQQEDTKHNISKPSPSLPCLLDESPPASNSRQPAQPMYASTPSKQLMSPTPTIHEMTSSTPTKDEAEPLSVCVKEESAQPKAVDSSQAKRKSEKLIPGFGTDIDEQLHEKAVLSISGDFITDKVIKEDAKSTDPVESLKSKTDDVKLEEKSRVVISQEETEDAVAALLGESFGTSNTQDFSIDYTVDPTEESSSQLASDSSQIPEEDNEEIKKAILSLNTEGLDMKPDTPTSEHDLQIDTDTEDQVDDEHPASLLRFDNPPKTPDVDLSQIGKALSDTLNSTSSAPNSAKKEDKLEIPDTPGKNVQIVASSPVTSTSQSTSVTTPVVSTTITSAPTVSVTSTVTSTCVSNTTQSSIVPMTPAVTGQQGPLPSTVATSAQGSNTKVVNVIPPVPKQIAVTTPPALPVQSNPTAIVAQKTTIVNQPPMVGNQPQIRQQLVMQAPPTITIPEQHIVYQPIDTMMSPRGPGGSDPRMQSPKMQHQPLSPFSRTSSPTATSPNLLRPQVMIQNRHPTQLSPGVGPHQMVVHQVGSHVVVSSPSPTNQFVPKPAQFVQSGNTAPRFPIAAGQLKTPPSLQKPTELSPLAKPNLNTFANIGMAPGVRLVTPAASPSSMPTLGNENASISTVGTKPVVSSSPMPVSTAYVIHPNAKPLETCPKTTPGTPTKTIIHQQPVYLQHPIKQFAPQHPVPMQSQMGINQQPNRLMQPVLTPVSNVIIAKPQEPKPQNTISTITSNPNHQMAPSSLSLPPIKSDAPLATPIGALDKVGEPKDKLSPLEEKDRTQATSQGSTVQPQPMMKLETSASASESARSLLTEENVAKIHDNSSAANVLDIDPEDQEADSKEDSDYWSSKDTIIDSVIKKVDALCSEDDISEGGSEVNKEEWNKSDDKTKATEQASLPSVSNTSGGQAFELPKVEEKNPEPATFMSTIPTTVPTPLMPVATTMMQATPSIPEPIVTPPEEDEAETASAESTTPTRGGKRGGRRGGRKTSESVSTPVKALVTEKLPEVDMTTPSKRGGKAGGSKRGRGAARGGAARGGASSVQPAVMGGGKGKHTSTGSDVYEFHDDSGEEVTGSDKQQADGSRPRLILTIKNQGTTATPTPSTSTAPVVVTSAPVIQPTMTTVGTISTPSVQLQPTTSCPAPQPPPEAQSIPAPAVDASKEEFIHPTSGNTRKSRRLLEKDGRTTVDDIIDDVIRNGPSSCVMPSSPAPVPSQPPSVAPTPMILQQFQSQQHVQVNQVNQMMSPTVQQPQLVHLPPQHQPVPMDLPGQTGRRNTRHNATPANGKWS